MRTLLLLSVLLGLVWLAGCASTDDSGMPWNIQQSWEGSPMIPGLSPTGR